MNRRIYTVFLVVLSLCTACSKDKDSSPAEDKNTIPNVIADNFNLTIFNAALNRSGLAERLSQTGPFMAFAPSDAAYKKAGFNDGTAIALAPPAQMANQTAYHLSSELINLSKLPLGMNKRVSNLLGTDLFLSRSVKGTDTLLTLNGARVLKSDIKASNGLVNVIDGLLEPIKFSTLSKALSAEPDLTLFYQALIRSGLLSSLDKETVFTVFAPSNAAIRAYGYADIVAISQADPAELLGWLRFHLMTGRNFAQDYFLKTEAGKSSYDATMLDGHILKINLLSLANVPNSFTGITVQGGKNSNAVNVVRQDVLTGNGVIQMVNGVLKN